MLPHAHVAFSAHAGATVNGEFHDRRSGGLRHGRFDGVAGLANDGEQRAVVGKPHTAQVEAVEGKVHAGGGAGLGIEEKKRERRNEKIRKKHKAEKKKK